MRNFYKEVTGLLLSKGVNITTFNISQENKYNQGEDNTLREILMVKIKKLAKKKIKDGLAANHEIWLIRVSENP